MPIRYWMQMGATACGSLLYLAAAITGWQPHSRASWRGKSWHLSCSNTS